MVITQEDLDKANEILGLFKQPCINENEKTLLESLCSDIYDNLTSVECRATYLVASTLRLRKTSCASGMIDYLQDYSNCNSCGLDVGDIVGNPNKKIWSLGGLYGTGCRCCVK